MAVRRDAAVLLATYNGEEFIGEFLESLVLQDHKEFTVFVRDDGSGDRTLSIVQSFADRLRIEHVASSDRLGPARSFLELLERAGDGFEAYFFADQDDYWRSAKIGRALDRLSSIPDSPAMYFSRLEYVDAELRHLKLSSVPRILSLENALVENVATGCSVALNRRGRELLLRCDAAGMLMHDWWSYIVIAAFGKICFDEYPTILYRQHSRNAVGAATSLRANFGRRFRRFLQYREGGGYRISGQAAAFRDCFGSMLNPRQSELVSALVAPKTVANRARLAFRSPLSRQAAHENLILRLMFLLGRY